MDNSELLARLKIRRSIAITAMLKSGENDKSLIALSGIQGSITAPSNYTWRKKRNLPGRLGTIRTSSWFSGRVLNEWRPYRSNPKWVSWQRTLLAGPQRSNPRSVWLVLPPRFRNARRCDGSCCALITDSKSPSCPPHVSLQHLWTPPWEQGESSGTDIACSRMLPSVRPLVQHYAAGLYGSSRTGAKSDRRARGTMTQILVLPIPSNRLLRHTLLRLACRPPTTSGGGSFYPATTRAL